MTTILTLLDIYIHFLEESVDFTHAEINLA